MQGGGGAVAANACGATQTDGKRGWAQRRLLEPILRQRRLMHVSEVVRAPDLQVLLKGYKLRQNRSAEERQGENPFDSEWEGLPSWTKWAKGLRGMKASYQSGSTRD